MNKKEFFKIVEIIQKEEKSFYKKNQNDLSTTSNIIKYLLSNLKLYLTKFNTIEFLPYFTERNIELMNFYYAGRKNQTATLAEEFEKWKKKR